MEGLYGSGISVQPSKGSYISDAGMNKGEEGVEISLY